MASDIEPVAALPRSDALRVRVSLIPGAGEKHSVLWDDFVSAFFLFRCWLKIG